MNRHFSSGRGAALVRNPNKLFSNGVCTEPEAIWLFINSHTICQNITFLFPLPGRHEQSSNVQRSCWLERWRPQAKEMVCHVWLWIPDQAQRQLSQWISTDTTGEDQKAARASHTTTLLCFVNGWKTFAPYLKFVMQSPSCRLSVWVWSFYIDEASKLGAEQPLQFDNLEDTHTCCLVLSLRAK